MSSPDLFRDPPRWSLRLRELGWHAEIWASCDRLAQEAPRLLRAGIPLVFDHMGGLDVERGLEDRSFVAPLRLLESGRVWIKLSAPAQFAPLSGL